MNYHPIVKISIMTGDTSGSGPAYPSETYEFSTGFVRNSCCSIIIFANSVL